MRTCHSNVTENDNNLMLCYNYKSIGKKSTINLRYLAHVTAEQYTHYHHQLSDEVKVVLGMLTEKEE